MESNQLQFNYQKGHWDPFFIAMLVSCRVSQGQNPITPCPRHRPRSARGQPMPSAPGASRPRHPPGAGWPAPGLEQEKYVEQWIKKNFTSSDPHRDIYAIHTAFYV